MRIQSIWIRIVICIAMIVVGCRAAKSKLNEAISGSGVQGYSQPGKGFKMLSREVTEAVCVTGDNGSSNDVIGAPKNADTTVRPQPENPNIPPSIITDPKPHSPDTDTPTTDPTDTPTNIPTTTPTIINDDPYTIPWGNLPKAKLGALAPASRLNVDAAIVMLGAQDPTPTPVAKSFALNSDQSGGAAVELFYLSTINDVRAAINASYKDSTSVGSAAGDVDADIGGQMAINLESKYRNTQENMYILMHGIKTFPLLSNDVITNPKFNPAYSKVVFGNSSTETPKDEAEIVKSYDTFHKMCGDFYIESVVRGREVWLVAIMERSTFELAMNGNVKVTSRSGVKPTAAEATEATKRNMTAGLSADYQKRLLKTQVEIRARSRGKTDITVGNFTVEDAIERLNKILAVDNIEGEGVIQLNVRPYNNVLASFGESDVRMGDLFSADIRQSSADILARLGLEKTWVSAQIAKISSTYDMDQWSFNTKIHNGVGKQFKDLKTYEQGIANIFRDCGGPGTDAKTASAECIANAKVILTKGRPAVNLPEPYPQRMEFYIPAIVKDAAAGKTSWGWRVSDMVTQSAAKEACRVAGYSMPDESNWKRIIDASGNYTTWQRNNNPGYRAENDDAALSYPCGRFQGGNFWTNEDRKVIQIKSGCASNDIRTSGVPASQYVGFFWTSEASRYGCVKFTPRNP